MLAKRVGTNSIILVYFCPLPPLPHTMLIYLVIWVQLLSTGVPFILPNVLSSKSNIVPGGEGYCFHLRADLLRRPLKGWQSTFAAIFRCVPTTFGNDCSSTLVPR